MKKVTNAFLFIFVSVQGLTNLSAQLSVPSAENVYGGRINSITVTPTGVDSGRIFISTESANSLFYADVYAPGGSAPVFSSFQALAGANANSGYGANIRNIAAHQVSGKVFFSDGANLLSTKPSSSAVNTIVSGVNTFAIVESTLLFNAANQFKWGILDAGGNFVISSNAPIANPLTGNFVSITVSATDSLVYLFQEGSAPQLYVSSDPYAALTASSTFTNISPTTLNPGYNWVAFGIAPDGRLFIGGTNFSAKYIAYSDNSTTWSEIATGINGTSGPNFAFSGDSTNYSVYYASVYSDSSGTSSWHNFGDIGGFETHANDGVVFTDPNNEDVVYMTTDQGLGASHSKGENIYEINDGIEAVQVKDFDMTPDKNTAWLASKSGIRKVNNYQTVPVWTNAIFPNGDGSPYYSVALKSGDTNTVYAGNVRVYKTGNAGTTWTKVFTAEDAPYTLNGAGLYVKAIEVCQYNPDIVFAGYYAENSNKGGVFYSMDGGVNWAQLLLEASAIGQDVDVRDIIFNVEGTDTVAYIGVEYDLSNPQGMSVYRAVKNGTVWTATQNFDGTHTTVGYQITATINDLYKSVTGDTLYACGTDAGLNEPHVYSKSISGTNKWDALTVVGFPYLTGNIGKAITVGNDTAYCAVDNEIYYLPIGAASWTLGYSYPVGNEINFLYFDELLVGAGTGLYSQQIDATLTSVAAKRPDNKNNNIKIYPNPIKNSATVTYTVNSNEHVTLILYDITGRLVSTIVNENKVEGTYKVTMNTEQLAKGMYVVTLQAGNDVSVLDVMVD